MRPLNLVGGIAVLLGIAAIGAIAWLINDARGDGSEPQLESDPEASQATIAHSATSTPISEPTATNSPGLAIEEVLGPGVPGPFSFGASTCDELWQAAHANMPEVGEYAPFETPADVTGDGDSNTLGSVPIGMTARVVAIRDGQGRFLFCDAGYRLGLTPLEGQAGLLESLERAGDNPHCCTEVRIVIAYRCSEAGFQTAWGMARDLPEPGPSPDPALSAP